MISNLLIFLTLVVGIWNSNRQANKATLEAQKATSQSKVNTQKLDELHSSVNGALAAAKAETLVASNRLLEVSTTAARAEGKADAIASVTEKSRSPS